jgi:sulfide:quinone oxidoreductase
MNIKTITPDFAITGQVLPAQLDEVAKMGFKSVICNRPDGEEGGQPSFSEIAASAKAAGMDARHIPVIPGLAGMNEVQAMAKAMAEMDGPVLAFCRSGARSEAMYNAARQMS